MCDNTRKTGLHDPVRIFDMTGLSVDEFYESEGASSEGYAIFEEWRPLYVTSVQEIQKRRSCIKGLNEIIPSMGVETLYSIHSALRHDGVPPPFRDGCPVLFGAKVWLDRIPYGDILISLTN